MVPESDAHTSRRVGVEAPDGKSPFGPLRFLYVGTADFEADLKYYRDLVGAEMLWNRRAFGARVAAFRVGTGLSLLIADHRPAPSCLPIFEVDDLEKKLKELKHVGISPTSPPFQIPNGPCALFKDDSGNEFAIFQDVRPNVFGDA